MIIKIDHLGIAVRSLDEAAKFYEGALGLKCSGREEVPSQKVRTAFYPAGETNLELLEPTAPDSPIAKFLAERGEGLHHVAFATNDISGQLAGAKTAGIRLINEVPLHGAHDKLVAFLHPKSTYGVLTEFCSPAPSAAAS